MSAAPKLSPTQAQAVAVIKARGGKIERWPGGFWTTPGIEFDQRPGYRVPNWYVGAGTVKALEKLGVLRETGRKWTRDGTSFAFEYELTEVAS